METHGMKLAAHTVCTDVNVRGGLAGLATTLCNLTRSALLWFLNTPTLQ